jgi:hypothetical protein
MMNNIFVAVFSYFLDKIYTTLNEEHMVPHYLISAYFSNFLLHSSRVTNVDNNG